MVDSIPADYAAVLVLPREMSLQVTTLPPMVQRLQAVPAADCPLLLLLLDVLDLDPCLCLGGRYFPLKLCGVRSASPCSHARDGSATEFKKPCAGGWVCFARGHGRQCHSRWLR